jgi:AcrR family transcriptional regulator
MSTAAFSWRVVDEVAVAVAESGVDGRPLPRASYLVGLAGVEGPERRVFMDPEVQRRRFLDAMGALIVDRGFPGPNIQDVSDRAEISRYAFIKHFTDIGDCFRAALVQAEVDLRDHVDASLRSVEGVYGRLTAMVEAVVDFARREPMAAKLAVAESFSEPAVCLPGYGEEFGVLRSWLAAQIGIGGSGGNGSVQQEAIIGAVETLVASRLRNGDGSIGVDLAGEVTYFLVSAFAGPGGFGDWFGVDETGLEV